MSNEEPQDNRTIDIPDDAIVVRPSGWAWGWYVVPFAIFVGVSLFVDLFTFSTLPLILALIVIVPRYLRWRSTAYILTDEHVVIQVGKASRQRYDLPISQVSDVQAYPGIFGRTLGYTAVHLVLRDKRVAILDHVPLRSPVVEHVRARIDTSASHEDEPTG